MLEIAAGTARNLPHYPTEVRITAIELSPEMAELGRRRAAELGREIDLRVGDAERLEFADESFDTVVCTYGLCTIPDDRAAIREAKRVLRPGGRLLLAEHVRSPNRFVRAIQRIIDPLAHRFGGDHLLREPLEHLAEEGFGVDELERSKAGFVELVAARKPGRDSRPRSRRDDEPQRRGRAPRAGGSLLRQAGRRDRGGLLARPSSIT